MRIRIALSTAMAVIVVPSVLFMSLSSNPAGAVRDRYQTGTHHRAGHHAGTLRGAGHHVGTRHRAVSHHESTRHREARIQSRATSLSKAKKSAELTSFDNAVKEALFVQAVNKAVFDQAANKAVFDQAVSKAVLDQAVAKAIAAQQAAAAAAQQAAAQQAAAQQAAAQQAAVQQAAAQQAAAASVPAPAPAAGGSDATTTNTPHWACIRQHESGGNYAVGGGGAYQFEQGTWSGLTGLGTPAQDSPPAVQDAAALRLFSQRGWEPWTTRFVCGL